MFNKEKLIEIQRSVAKLESLLCYVLDDYHALRTGQKDIAIWLELIADDGAEKIASRFDALLEQHIARKQKVTNDVLHDLVKQAATRYPK